MVETLLNTPFQKGNSIKQQTTGPEKPPNQTIWWLKGLPNKGFQRTSSWETEHPFHSPKSSLFTMTDSRPINSSHVSMMFGLVETTQHYWLQALMLRIRKKCAPNLWCDSWWPPTLSLYMLGHVDTRLDTRLDTCWSIGGLAAGWKIFRIPKALRQTWSSRFGKDRSEGHSTAKNQEASPVTSFNNPITGWGQTSRSTFSFFWHPFF